MDWLFCILVLSSKVFYKVKHENVGILFNKEKGRRNSMNTDFLFDNFIIFPLLAIIVIATYIIQFCSVISPCNIEFDGDNAWEMRLMKSYNILSDKTFTVYISAVVVGIMVAMLFTSTLVLFMILVLQLSYLILTMSVFLSMYERSKRYWTAYQCKNSPNYLSVQFK